MEHLDIILPIAVLVLTFIIKLSIDRPIDLTGFIKAICELPVDIVFLAVSFIIAVIITNREKTAEGLLYFIGYIIAAIIVTILWQKCLRHFTAANNKTWIALLCINLFCSVCVVAHSISMFSDPISKSQPNIEIVKNGN